MTSSPGLGVFVSDISGLLTSANAVASYEAIGSAAVVIGVFVYIGPRLWEYLWRFFPEDSGHGDGYYGQSFGESDGGDYEDEQAYLSGGWG